MLGFFTVICAFSYCNLMLNQLYRLSVDPPRSTLSDLFYACLHGLHKCNAVTHFIPITRLILKDYKQPFSFFNERDPALAINDNIRKVPDEKMAFTKRGISFL